jgi:hypothetical protein
MNYNTKKLMQRARSVARAGVRLSGGAQRWGSSQLSVGTRRLLATGATGHGGAFLFFIFFVQSFLGGAGADLIPSPPQRFAVGCLCPDDRTCS